MWAFKLSTDGKTPPKKQTKEALEVNQHRREKKFGCSTLDGIPSSIPFEARPIHGEKTLAFCWLFTVRRIREEEEKEKKTQEDEEEEEEIKSTTQLSDRSSAEEALSNIHFAPGTREACLKVSVEMHCAACVRKLCEWSEREVEEEKAMTSPCEISPIHSPVI